MKKYILKALTFFIIIFILPLSANEILINLVGKTIIIEDNRYGTCMAVVVYQSKKHDTKNYLMLLKGNEKWHKDVYRGNRMFRPLFDHKTPYQWPLSTDYKIWQITPDLSKTLIYSSKLATELTIKKEIEADKSIINQINQAQKASEVLSLLNEKYDKFEGITIYSRLFEKGKPDTHKIRTGSIDLSIIKETNGQFSLFINYVVHPDSWIVFKRVVILADSYKFERQFEDSPATTAKVPRHRNLVREVQTVECDAEDLKMLEILSKTKSIDIRFDGKRNIDVALDIFQKQNIKLILAIYKKLIDLTN